MTIIIHFIILHWPKFIALKHVDRNLEGKAMIDIFGLLETNFYSSKRFILSTLSGAVRFAKTWETTRGKQQQLCGWMNPKCNKQKQNVV